MQQPYAEPVTADYDSEELKGFSRSIAELQWLLLILVLLYFFIPIRAVTNPDALIVTMVAYSLFVLVFRYLNFQARETRLKLAVETWAMIGFITTTLWHTGYTDSPLLNLYLLVIIASAITLGKVMTLLEVALIACCYLFMGYKIHGEEIFMASTFTMLMAKFSPFLLVAYVTSMLASDIIAAKRRITHLSQTDDLTATLNMRAFSMLFEKEVARASRYGSPMSVIMVDIDSLKIINDCYGHATGSRLLRAVADTLRACIRSSDAVARYGGDEFIILLGQASSADAHATAERIRSAVAEVPVVVNGERVSTTASVGVAGFPGDVQSPAELIEKADVALYKSKQAGRNRVTWYTTSLEAMPACA